MQEKVLRALGLLGKCKSSILENFVCVEKMDTLLCSDTKQAQKRKANKRTSDNSVKYACEKNASDSHDKSRYF
jgi:hypothetical protein